MKASFNDIMELCRRLDYRCELSSPALTNTLIIKIYDKSKQFIEVSDNWNDALQMTYNYLKRECKRQESKKLERVYCDCSASDSCPNGKKKPF